MSEWGLGFEKEKAELKAGADRMREWAARNGLDSGSPLNREGALTTGSEGTQSNKHGASRYDHNSESFSPRRDPIEDQVADIGFGLFSARCCELPGGATRCEWTPYGLRTGTAVESFANKLEEVAVKAGSVAMTAYFGKNLDKKAPNLGASPFGALMGPLIGEMLYEKIKDSRGGKELFDLSNFRGCPPGMSDMAPRSMRDMKTYRVTRDPAK